eukprot:11120096-Lingulodinium_polyedra.AAC.1
MASARRRHVAAISSLAVPAPPQRCASYMAAGSSAVGVSMAPTSSMPRATPTLLGCGQLPGWR